MPGTDDRTQQVYDTLAPMNVHYINHYGWMTIDQLLPYACKRRPKYAVHEAINHLYMLNLKLAHEY